MKNSESGIVRLVRTACKALSKHGRACHLPFRGNCFNILFYDAGALYYISDAVKTFFRVVWQTQTSC